MRAAFDKVVRAFGGVDIVVSNAGAAWQGTIGKVDDETLRKSFELNFWAHQTVAQNAVRIMQAQGTFGCLLFNTSKQAVNPGKDFGPYGLPKAATLFLVKQYALDHGKDGIRANAVNADRIRTGPADRRDGGGALQGARPVARPTTWAAICSGAKSRPTTWPTPSSISPPPTKTTAARHHRRWRQYRSELAVRVSLTASASIIDQNGLPRSSGSHQCMTARMPLSKIAA